MVHFEWWCSLIRMAHVHSFVIMMVSTAQSRELQPKWVLDMVVPPSYHHQMCTQTGRLTWQGKVTNNEIVGVPSRFPGFPYAIWWFRCLLRPSSPRWQGHFQSFDCELVRAGGRPYEVTRYFLEERAGGRPQGSSPWVNRDGEQKVVKILLMRMVIDGC